MSDVMPNTQTNDATNPPTSESLDVVKSTCMSGAVLIVGVERELGDKLRSSLLDYGFMAMSTSSELKALELLRSGGLFDAIVVGLPTDRASSLHFLRQIRARRAEIPLLVISDATILERARTSMDASGVSWQPNSTTADTLAQMLCEAIAQMRDSIPRTSGIMPILRSDRYASIAH